MKLIRCNRCGTEMEIPQRGGISGIMRAIGSIGESMTWHKIHVIKPSPQQAVPSDIQVLDVCEDCREVFLLQFMAGAEVKAITKTAEQTVLPHDPMVDCALVFDPEAGRLICVHDDSDRYYYLAEEACQATVRPTAQRCTAECTECHTYEAGCLLDSRRLNDSEELVTCPTLQGGCGGRVPRRALTEHLTKVHGLKDNSIPIQREMNEGGVDNE